MDIVWALLLFPGVSVDLCKVFWFLVKPGLKARCGQKIKPVRVLVSGFLGP